MSLTRLLNPSSIAVVGGGAWCASIIEAAKRIGYTGAITPVHPTGKMIAGIPSVQSLTQLNPAPDATFIGVNRNATVEVVSELNRLGAGGAICFASGFAEAQAELDDGSDLQAQLLDAAGTMPILGPNCYGFINAFDQATIWPDQHGCKPLDRGVAILTQSSNIAINLTMQKRALPIGYMITCGNQAQLSQADIAAQLLDDRRVSAIGLHIEGFGDLRAWEKLANKAYTKGIPLVALKVGTSKQAQAATISHTASLAGSDAAAEALFQRFGIRRAGNLATFLEALKILHVNGPLSTGRIGSISCSGGEASLAADLGQAAGLEFPALTPSQTHALSTALGPKVALANPLDYHTYIWRDANAMTSAWSALDDPQIDLTMTIVDYPREDICSADDWVCATTAAIETHLNTGKPTALVASLPELLPEDVAQHLMANDVTPLHGLHDALDALAICSRSIIIDTNPALFYETHANPLTLTEASAKAELAKFGLDLPKGAYCDSLDGIATACDQIGYPLVLKGLGTAHKTEAGLVALNLTNSQHAKDAAAAMPAQEFLLEEMIINTVAEIIVGITKDPLGCYMMTIGAGGVLTELMIDTSSLILPATEHQIADALDRLKISAVLNGYRGTPPANKTALIEAILGIQNYVIAKDGKVEEVEVNPLICTPDRAIAVDALIRKV